jgi:spore coat polysaccharide biosynthesis predicted glycosyltransferase SpsG
VIKPRIAIFTGGGFSQGFGHIFRTLTIADGLKASFDVLFLINPCTPCKQKISDRGYSLVEITKKGEILNALVNYSPHISILDKPRISKQFIKNLQKNSNSKIVIFDNDNAIASYADILVNALAKNYCPGSISLHSNQRTLLFNGLKYLILRNEFFEKESRARISKDEFKNILITFGGSDPTNLTCMILKDLNALNLDISIKVILGVKYKFQNILNELLGENEFENSRISVCRDIPNMSEMMSMSDIIITHPGITMFEALYLKKPVIIASQNTIQENYYAKFFETYEGEPLYPLLSKKTHTIYPKKVEDLQIGRGKEEVLRAIKQLV